MKKTMLLLMSITVISKLFGFLREVVLANYFGASMQSDAYLIAFAIPFALFSLYGSVAHTGFIPLYTRIENERGQKEANRFANHVLHALLLFGVLMVVLGLIFTGPLVRIFAVGFDSEAQALAVRFTRISLFSILALTLSGFFTNILQLHERYLATGITGFPYNLILIVSIAAAAGYNTMWLAYGGVAALFSQFFIYLPFIKKSGFRYSFGLSLHNRQMLSLARLSLPVFIGSSAFHINSLIDRTIASSIVQGGISALNYAGRLNYFIEGIVIASIVSVLFPMLSKSASVQDMDALKNKLSDAIDLLVVLLIPAGAAIALFSQPIVQIVFARGAFDAQAASLTTSALFFYALGLLGYGLRNVLTNTFFALKDMVTPLKNGLIAIALNILLNLILSRFLGIGGLALATAISAFFASFLLMRALVRRQGVILRRTSYILMGKSVLATAGMLFCVESLWNGLTDRLSPVTAFFVVMVAGIILYTGLMIGMRAYPIKPLFRMLRAIWKTRNTDSQKP